MTISRELVISLAIKAGARIDCGTICFNEKDIDDFIMRFAELLTSAEMFLLYEELVKNISEQEPEKPDYWSSCSQCQRNIEDVQELLPKDE
jgi:hypothetical protein